MKEKLFERMGGTYRKEGDYLLPNVAAPEQPTFGPFGWRHYAYIRKHDKILFSSLWLSGELNAYIENIDRQADEMFSQLVRDIAKNENVTERLKATDQMEWVRRMNSIRHRAEEIVNEELILR